MEAFRSRYGVGFRCGCGCIHYTRPTSDRTVVYITQNDQEFVGLESVSSLFGGVTEVVAEHVVFH